MLVLRRQNGPQLLDHRQDVSELELGNTRDEGPASLAPQPIPVAIPRRLEECRLVLRGPPTGQSTGAESAARVAWPCAATPWQVAGRWFGGLVDAV